MKLFNFLLMNVLFISGLSFVKDDVSNLQNASSNDAVVSYQDVVNTLESNDIETVKIVSDNFNSFEELLTYFISLIGSFLGTLLINIIKSKFPNLFLRKSEVVKNVIKE